MSNIFPVAVGQSIADAKNALRSELEQFGLTRYVEEILANVKLGYALTPAKFEHPNLTKLGGLPTAPENFQWPRRKATGRPLSFIGQIDTSRLSFENSTDNCNAAFPKGLLAFFCDAHDLDDGSMSLGNSRADRDGFAVHLWNHSQRKGIFAPPSDLEPHLIYKEQMAVLKEHLSLIGAADLAAYLDFNSELGRGDYIDTTYDKYDDFLQRFQWDKNKFLGAGDFIQHNPNFKCHCYMDGGGEQEVLSLPSHPERWKKMFEDAKHWIMLLQIVSSVGEDNFDFECFGQGALYFFIKDSDLKNGVFDRIWAVMQYG